MKITRQFIAEKAGVSPTTVSDVINGTPKARISSEARARVLKVAKKYNYVPNFSARTLVTGKSFNIGFMYKDAIFNFMNDPFNHEIFTGLESEIEKNDYSLIFSLLKDDKKLNTSVKRMLYGNYVDGIILTGVISKKLVTILENNMIPYVLIDYILPGHDHNAVLPDNFAGAKNAAAYLIKEGCSNITFLNGDFSEVAHPSYIERPAGYRSALDDAGLKPEIKSVPPDIDGSYQAVIAMLNAGDIPHAFMTAGDQIAMGTTRALRDYGSELLSRIRVIGFDDISWMKDENPPISTVRVPKVEMGIEAVRLLLNSINDKTASKKIVRLSTSIIIRQT